LEIKKGEREKAMNFKKIMFVLFTILSVSSLASYTKEAKEQVKRTLSWKNIFADMKEGIRYIWRQQEIFFLLVVAGALLWHDWRKYREVVRSLQQEVTTLDDGFSPVVSHLYEAIQRDQHDT